MSCDCCHKSSALSAAGLLTVSNANNVGDFDPFCLVLTINPSSVITATPVALTITINGNNVPVWDKWGYAVTTDRVRARRCYKGRYIAPESGTSHLTLFDLSCGPDTAATAQRSAEK